MDRNMKIGVSLLAIGFALLGISYIALAVAQSSASVAAIILCIFVAPGFALTLIGVGITISAMSPVRRGILSIAVGMVFYALILLAVFSSVAWPDIAMILTVIGFLFVSSLFIIPGVITIRYQRFDPAWYVVCVLTATTMLWAFILLTVVPYALKVPDFRTYFYEYLWINLVIGFILGIVTTSVIYARYYWERHW